MNLKVNYIPPNWNPKDPRAVAKWMKEKLPIVRNYRELESGLLHGG